MASHGPEILYNIIPKPFRVWALSHQRCPRLPLYFRYMEKICDNTLKRPSRGSQILYISTHNAIGSGYWVTHISIHRPHPLVGPDSDIAMRSDRNRISLLPRAVCKHSTLSLIVIINRHRHFPWAHTDFR